MSCSGGLIVLATILGPITLIFMAVSFGTDYWIIFNVDKDQLSSTDKDVSNAKWTHSRYQGLFRVCYPGNESTLSCELLVKAINIFCFTKSITNSFFFIT